MTGTPAAPDRDRFAGHPRLAGHDASAGSDTHGLPWAGRSLHADAFAGDDGSADPAVTAALADLAAAADPKSAAPDRRSPAGPAASTDPVASRVPAEGVSAAEAQLVTALAASRVLVPILAAPAEDGAETVSTMATALLRGPDGTLAQPVFTSVAALAAWDVTARPVPTPVPDAARAALAEGCAVMPIDLGDPHAAVLRGSQLWALALGEGWQPAHTDPVVRLAVAEAGQGIDGLLAARAEDGSLHAPGTLRLVLTLRPGLPAAVVDQIVGRLGERLAADPDVRRRIDDLAVVLHQASDPADGVPPEPPLLA